MDNIQKQLGSCISTAQVFLHSSVTLLPMLHWDIEVGDLEVLYFVVKELINKENCKVFFMHFQYCSQPPVNHVNSWKSWSPVQKWWNRCVAGLHLQNDPLIKGSGEMYLQDHRQVYVLYMLSIS